MILCTLAGPDPRAFNTSRRGAEVGKPLRDGESYLFEKRRAGTLMRECWLVNGTLVRWRCSSPHGFCASFRR
jgi:hypothetical protein